MKSDLAAPKRPVRQPESAGARAALGISPQTLVSVIKRNVTRRPLWSVMVVENFFDLSRERVMESIESGDYPWVFNIGTGRKSREYRILALSVLELNMPAFKAIGATKNLKLTQIIDLILPQRDVRSTELRRIFSCSSHHVYHFAKYFTATQMPTACDGPNSFTVFSRASVARFLEKRRMA